MKIYVTSILLIIITNYLVLESLSESDIQTGYEVTLAIPTVYTEGFLGRAFVMVTEAAAASPNFRVAINVEAVQGKYSCSLDIFLGDVRVWSSGHFSTFYTSDKCVLQLTLYGDLRLKGPNDRIGWRTGTSGQGVQRLHLLNTGNLVLVDALNLIKWQSFNFPTDIMLWGQRLSSQTRLTSFPSNSTLFYSMEIQDNRLALYLNLGKFKYSYWEHTPSTNKNITFVQLTSYGLEIFNGDRRFDQIKSTRPEPLRFLSLENGTGNLRLYHYSSDNHKFEPSYQAVKFTCDLPLACKQYGFCTTSGSCSCIRLTNHDALSDCGDGGVNYTGLCGGEMLELQGVVSILRSVFHKAGVNKHGCANLCLDDCACVSAQYDGGTCYMYRMVRGIKQVERGSRVVYMVKVPKGTSDDHEKNSGLKKWEILVIVVADGFIILVVLGGFVYYVVRKRKKNAQATDQAN